MFDHTPKDDEIERFTYIQGGKIAVPDFEFFRCRARRFGAEFDPKTVETVLREDIEKISAAAADIEHSAAVDKLVNKVEVDAVHLGALFVQHVVRLMSLAKVSAVVPLQTGGIEAGPHEDQSAISATGSIEDAGRAAPFVEIGTFAPRTTIQGLQLRFFELQFRFSAFAKAKIE